MSVFKKFFKSISNSHISLSFLLIWKWNDEYVHTLPYFPRKPYPIPDQNKQSVYPFSDQNGTKTLRDGAAHTYLAYIREYPHPLPDVWTGPYRTSQNFLSRHATLLPKDVTRQKRLREGEFSQNSTVALIWDTNISLFTDPLFPLQSPLSARVKNKPRGIYWKERKEKYNVCVRATSIYLFTV